jgi:hypothetical protein
MNFSFHPEAEFLETIDYYERCRDGFGYEFAVEVYSAVERIVAHPRIWPILQGDVRRSLLSRFPHGVVYAEADGHIYVLAVMHLHRDPDYWKPRQA